MNSRLLFPLVTMVIIGAAIYALWPDARSENEPIYCTQDAKLCPNGSYVGRVPPNCEFAACPDQADADQLETAELQTRYIHAQDWPPTITRNKKGYTCDPLDFRGENYTGGIRTERSINGRTYCVEQQTEGAAGSQYIHYKYNTIKDGNHVSAEFTLRYPNCDNYPDPQKTECEQERQSFNLDRTIDTIIQQQ